MEGTDYLVLRNARRQEENKFMKKRKAQYSFTIVLAVIIVVAIRSVPAGHAGAEDEKARLSEYIWPKPDSTSAAGTDNPALPKVEKVDTCLKKYGVHDWRTWRAQYFENRLRIPEDPYRYERTSFEAAADRGMMCNIWTGTPFPIYGMNGESSRLILYPLTGSKEAQVQTVALHRGESCDIHNQYASETLIVVWYGSGELYLFDHWIPVTGEDIGYAPVGCPMAWRCPKDNPEDMVLFIVTSPPPFAEYVKTGLMVKRESQEGKKGGWPQVLWKWANPALAGLLGQPEHHNYPR